MQQTQGVCLNRPTTEQISAAIANGHAYNKHVLGADNDYHPGENEFRKASLGRDLKIETKQDLHDYLKDFFSKEGTRGFADPRTPGRYVFYNPRDNVMVVFNADNKDLGTIFRPDRRSQEFKELLDDARYKSAHRIPMAQTPDEIAKLAERFGKDIIRLPSGAQARITSVINDGLHALGRANRNIVLDAGIGVAVGATMLISGASPAEAAEAAGEMMNPIPSTTDALCNGGDASAIREAAVQDASALGGCFAGGAVGLKLGAAGGTAIAPGLGSAAGGLLGSIVGCAAGAWAGSETVRQVVKLLKDKEKTNPSENPSFPHGKIPQDIPQIPGQHIPPLDIQTAYDNLPDKSTEDMPPEVAALVEAKASQELFEKSFAEIERYGGLPEIMAYIKAHPLETKQPAPVAEDRPVHYVYLPAPGLG